MSSKTAPLLLVSKYIHIMYIQIHAIVKVTKKNYYEVDEHLLLRWFIRTWNEFVLSLLDTPSLP